MQQYTEYSRLKVGSILTVGLISFGFAPILVRLAGGISPFVLAAFRTGFAVLILTPYWGFAQQSQAHQDDRWLFELKTAIAGICLGVHFTFWIASLSYTSVASASVLVTIHPVMLIVAERFIFKRHFSLKVWLGVLLAFSGSVLLGITDQQATDTFSNPLLGNTLAFTAAVIFSIYLLIGQQVRQQTEWIDYVYRVYFVGALTCLILSLLWGVSLFDINSAGIWAGLGLAVGPQILGHGSMNYAVKYIAPTILSTLILAEPLIASVLAFILFDEVPPAASLIAFAIILGGILVTVLSRKR